MRESVEYCDVVDGSGTRTGRRVPRGTALAPGEFYPVVHVWIRDENGEYLIQQRAVHLDSGPGIWATTVGYVKAGEDSLSGAIRETGEELGLRLSPGCLRRWGRLTTENRMEDHWLAEVSRNSIGVPVPGAEVADWKWVSRARLAQMVSRGEFFRYSYLDELLA